MWQTEFKESYRTAQDLFQAGFISEEEQTRLHPVLEKFQFVLPRYYASLIDKKDPLCPIALQAIPKTSELLKESTTFSDPLGDLLHKPRPKLTHRFRGRVLLHLSPNCSMYCRFCFRKTLLNELKPDLFGGSIDEALIYIEEDPSIEEIIFSGGDPLMASDQTIQWMLEKISRFQNIQRIRFHTRVPVTFPMRVTGTLIQALGAAKKPTAIVTHFNHPKELTCEAKQACTSLKATGFMLLNQSVLLKNVNDDIHTLSDLSRGLFTFGILPYYLHQLDRADGTSHFEVEEEKALSLYAQMRATLSGYLVPRLVQDRVGSDAKVEL